MALESAITPRSRGLFDDRMVSETKIGSSRLPPKTHDPSLTVRKTSDTLKLRVVYKTLTSTSQNCKIIKNKNQKKKNKTRTVTDQEK